VPDSNQPILRHTWGVGLRPAGFTAALYGVVRGHFPDGCIPVAGNKRTTLGCHSPALAILHTPEPVHCSGGQSRNL